MPAREYKNQTIIGTPDPKGGDSATISFGPDDSGSSMTNCVIDGSSCEWGLKISHCFNLTFTNCTIVGGTERALDIVRGGLITFNNCRFGRGNYRTTTRKKWSLQKTCDIGIKGGARDVTFNNCQMNDLLLGDWSIYNQRECPKTRRIILNNCTATNTWPIIIRGLDTEKAGEVSGTRVDSLYLPGVAVSLYFLYNKHFGDDRKLNADELVPLPIDLE